jgi:hypothetical protein
LRRLDRPSGEHPRQAASGDSSSAAGQSGSSGLDNISGFLLSYEVRFYTGSLACDVGFINPVGDSDDSLLLGIPFVSISYRW